MKRAALFSLNDTTGAEQFAANLIRCGWDIIASSETVALLRSNGLAVMDIADFTGVHEQYGFPPTLHARVEHALTGGSDPSIDLVYVIPYPRSQGNDIGGRTLLGLAVKGGKTAVMNVDDMKKAVSRISTGGTVDESLRRELADKACAEIARHYAALVEDTETRDFQSGHFALALKNGENPYQFPASAFVNDGDEDGLSLLNSELVSGENPCFTNMADMDSVLSTLCLGAEAFGKNTASVPYICIAAKHGNACGAAIDKESPARSIEGALFGNPRSIWGGEVITNAPINGELARLLLSSATREKSLGNASWMLDVIVAPSISPEAVAILGKRRERKLFQNRALLSPRTRKTGHSYRPVRGGFLRQPSVQYILDLTETRTVGPGGGSIDRDSLILAWAVAYSSNHGGNEIALVKNNRLVGAGGGPSTVEAARSAVERAKECGHDVQGAVFAADAFFPFTDAPAVLADAGVSAGCVPVGGKKEKEVQEFFGSRGIAMAYLPPQFRGFCRH